MVWYSIGGIGATAITAATLVYYSIFPAINPIPNDPTKQSGSNTQLIERKYALENSFPGKKILEELLKKHPELKNPHTHTIPGHHKPEIPKPNEEKKDTPPVQHSVESSELVPMQNQITVPAPLIIYDLRTENSRLEMRIGASKSEGATGPQTMLRYSDKTWAVFGGYASNHDNHNPSLAEQQQFGGSVKRGNLTARILSLFSTKHVSSSGTITQEDGDLTTVETSAQRGIDNIKDNSLTFAYGNPENVQFTFGARIKNTVNRISDDVTSRTTGIGSNGVPEDETITFKDNTQLKFGEQTIQAGAQMKYSAGVVGITGIQTRESTKVPANSDINAGNNKNNNNETALNNIIHGTFNGENFSCYASSNLKNKVFAGGVYSTDKMTLSSKFEKFAEGTDYSFGFGSSGIGNELRAHFERRKEILNDSTIPDAIKSDLIGTSRRIFSENVKNATYVEFGLKQEPKGGNTTKHVEIMRAFDKMQMNLGVSFAEKQRGINAGILYHLENGWKIVAEGNLNQRISDRKRWGVGQIPNRADPSENNEYNAQFSFVRGW